MHLEFEKRATQFQNTNSHVFTNILKRINGFHYDTFRRFGWLMDDRQHDNV